MGIEKHIAPFIAKKRSCGLPGIGKLEVSIQEPVFDQADQVMHPPISIISFSGDVAYSPEFENYVALQEGISVADAGRSYQEFSDSLYRLKYGSEFVVPSLGSFYVDETGKLRFQPLLLPALKPNVKAIRVVHPEASHAILVGDRQSDSVEMTGLLYHEDEKRRSRWWIAALVIFILSVVAILIHYSENEGFGNNSKISSPPDPQTYTVPGR